MSLMAGFDLVTEISNKAILGLIKSSMRLGGTLMNPPFEMNVGAGLGVAHVIVEDLQIDLNTDDTMTLTFLFDNTTIALPAINQAVCPLDGIITIKAPISLIAARAPNQVMLAVDLSQAATTFSLSQSAMAQVTAAFGNLANAVVAGAATSLTAYIQGLGVQRFERMTFVQVPNTNGSLAPLQFAHLEVHCIAAQSRDQQALGLFGILLSANQGRGDHHQKGATAIAPNHDLAVSLSPGAFHALAFCPRLAAFLGTSIAGLPTTCGGASSAAVPGGQGYSLSHCSDTFVNGSIRIDGSIDKSGFCYDAHGTFSANAVFSISAGSVVSTVSVGQPSTSIDIPWYCWLAAGLVLGPLGLVIVGIADAIAQGLAHDIANGLISSLGSGLSAGFGLGGFGSATFNSVAVTTEGLTIGGKIVISLPTPPSRSVRLVGSVTVSQATKVSSGTYHSDFCPVGDWPYDEFSNEEAGTFNVEGTLMAPPFGLTWSISDGVTPQQLVGQQGTVTLSLPCKYPQPIASGGTTITQSVAVAWSKVGNSVVLTNRPQDGDYQCFLMVRVSDCAGHILAAAADVAFNGDTIVIGGGYQAAYAACIKALVDRLRHELVGTFGIPLTIPPVNYPTPDQLQQFVRFLSLVGTQEAEAAVISTMLAHGTSFNRAINALSVSGLRTAVKTAAER
ncbi:MAG TPA: hypothetical protein DEV93_10030 [Chloroflexi bacterium]|jgi:hypothetical protein|nr:hypothetical protein [Chloroflexota bacterium]